MKRIIVLVVLAGLVMGSLAGCAGKEEQTAYMQAQLQALALQKPLLEIEGFKDQPIVFKKLTVYAPGQGQIQQYVDPWANVATNALGVLGAVGGIWVGGDAAVRLADTVGKHASAVYTHSYNQTAPPPEPVIVTQPEPIVVKGE